MDDPTKPGSEGIFPTALPRSGRLELVARELTRTINRRYSIEHCVDLFGVHLVETSWGRYGSWGQSKRDSFDDPADADRAVRNHLRRRARAPRRIGVAYRVVGGGS